MRSTPMRPAVCQHISQASKILQLLISTNWAGERVTKPLDVIALTPDRHSIPPSLDAAFVR